MLKNDYIIRLIEQMGDILRAVLDRRKSGRYEECRKEIDKGYELLGLSRRLVMTMPCDQILWLLDRFGRVERERYLALSRLMRADGQVYEDEGRYDEAYGMYQSSLTVLKAIPRDEELSGAQEVEKEEAKTQFLIGKIVGQHPKDHE